MFFVVSGSTIDSSSQTQPKTQFQKCPSVGNAQNARIARGLRQKSLKSPSRRWFQGLICYFKGLLQDLVNGKNGDANQQNLGIWTNNHLVDGARWRKVGTWSTNTCAKKPMVKGFNPLWKYWSRLKHFAYHSNHFMRKRVTAPCVGKTLPDHLPSKSRMDPKHRLHTWFEDHGPLQSTNHIPQPLQPPTIQFLCFPFVHLPSVLAQLPEPHRIQKDAPDDIGRGSGWTDLEMRATPRLFPARGMQEDTDGHRDKYYVIKSLLKTFTYHH